MRSIANQSGFTLLELLVVLSIIGLLSALSVPRLAGSIGSTNLKTAAADTAAVFRYARNQAVGSRNTVRCKIGPDRKTIVVQPDTPETDSEDEQLFQKVYTAPDGIEITVEKETDFYRDGQELSSFLFHPDGSSSGGEVTIIDKKTESQFVCRINFITGTVTIEEQENR